MLVSAIIIVIIFITMIVLIAFEYIEREILAIIGAIITYFVILFIENGEFEVIIDFLIGTKEENYVNLRSIILIFGMMTIVEIAIEGGLFQFLAFRLIQMTNGNPRFLLLTFCILSFVFAAIINDILTVILLIPLTIMVCRILDIDPIPYIISQAIVIKLGASVFLISSIPNILIAGYAQISFIDFFLTIGIYSIVVFVITLLIFYGYYRKKLEAPKQREGIDFLLDYDVWTFIQHKKLMYKSSLILIGVIIGFIVIPPEILSPDIIAFTGAAILLLISRKDIDDIFKKIDFKLIFYLMGVFIIIGGLEYVGVINYIGNIIGDIAPNDSFLTFLMVLWLSAFLSSVIDNVPVTRILLPTIDILARDYKPNDKTFFYSGMTYGVNLGDNLVPVGDVILVMNAAEKQDIHLKPINYFKIAFPITIIQLSIISVLFSLLMRPLHGILILISAFGFTLLIYIAIHHKNNRIKSQSTV